MERTLATTEKVSSALFSLGSDVLALISWRQGERERERERKAQDRPWGSLIAAQLKVLHVHVMRVSMTRSQRKGKSTAQHISRLVVV